MPMRRSSDEQGDADLLGRAREGDNQARAELRRRYDANVVKEVSRWPESIREDAVVETWLRVFDKKIETVRSSGAYIRGIARNVCRELHRKVTRTEQLPVDGDSPLPPHEVGQPLLSPDPVIETLKAEFKECVWQVIERLTNEDHRNAIILFYIEGLKVTEIAALLQISTNTVKTRLLRAREKMKQLFQQDDTVSGFLDELGIFRKLVENPNVSLQTAPDDPHIRISLDVLHHCDITLQIANGSRPVGSLIDSSRRPGKATYRWNGPDEDGNRIRPGEYTIFIEANDGNGCADSLPSQRLVVPDHQSEGSSR
jgi:RNA polymerase sigma factor (sigma-70 family)